MYTKQSSLYLTHKSVPFLTAYIQIIFMDDLAPMKRCFLGIITPVVSQSTRSPIKESKTTTDATKQVQLDNENKCTTANPVCCQLNVPPSSTKNDRLINGEDHATTLECENSSLKKEPAFKSLPCGRIVRVDDETLCDFVIGSK